MARHVERGGVPGLVGLVARRGEVHVEACGERVLGGGDPVRRDSMFRIASVTKPITAAAAMVLVEECVLRLDDAVDEFLPELAGQRVLRSLESSLDDLVPAERPITVRDLMTFTLGFGAVMAMPGTYPIQDAIRELRIGGDGYPQPDLAAPTDEWLRNLGSLPLIAQPGEQWMYQTGADVLGVLIERAAGQSLEAFMRERIFEPLGMRDTAFYASADRLERFTAAYVSDELSMAPSLFDPVEGQWSRPPAMQSGGGGLVSTADDLLAFGRMMLGLGSYEGTRLLSRPSVEAMTSDQLTPAQKAASTFVPRFFDCLSWGFGMSVRTRREDGTLNVGTYGWDGGLGSMWYVDPREELITILLTSKAMGSPQWPAVFRDFTTCAYAALAD
jgi:CubicO group peptidase (beta-lactamase class C family)